MAGRTLTRADLASAANEATGVSRAVTAELLDQALDEIIEALERGEPVRVSSFGTFEVRHKGERVGRNPKTGDEVGIARRSVVSFRPSDVLKRFINRRPNGAAEDTPGDTSD